MDKLRNKSQFGDKPLKNEKTVFLLHDGLVIMQMMVINKLQHADGLPVMTMTTISMSKACLTTRFFVPTSI